MLKAIKHVQIIKLIKKLLVSYKEWEREMERKLKEVTTVSRSICPS